MAKPILPPLSVAATGTVYKDCFSLSRTWLENISPETKRKAFIVLFVLSILAKQLFY